MGAPLNAVFYLLLFFSSLVLILKLQMMGEAQEANKVKLLDDVCVAVYQLLL